jgi:NADPH:quinone reductase-like Zn-dependent oxidoreductase
MKAAVLRELGSAPRYEQFDDPVARDGEVLVNVRASSLKPIDKSMASGAHYASFHELPVICVPTVIPVRDPIHFCRGVQARALAVLAGTTGCPVKWLSS